MPLPWHSNEERNYVCLRKIVTDIVSEGLRTIFKQEWNNRYQATTGAWDDTGVSGILLFNLEKARPRAKDYLAKFQNGNTKEWDCTVLCDAILYSKCIGKAGLKSSIKAEVNNLRELRNQVIHVSEGKLLDHVFKDITEKIRNSFLALGLSVKALDEVKMERKRFASFQVLPPHPAHDVVSRQDTVSSISTELSKLYSDNDCKLTYLYISGNPGSGKSQLAREIGESHYSDIIKKQGELTFVMTLNAKSLDSLLESYADFARRLNCPEQVIANIINMKETTPEAKIRQLRTQVAQRIKSYKSWLIIADNVEDLKLVSSLLPQLKDEEWSNGQVLITTQDSLSIPSNTSFTTHVSLSKGMGDTESCHLLATLSGTGDDPTLTNVAKQLDYQPLALAAAAVYVKQVIETKASSEFSWRDYLEKLEQGKGQLTQGQLRDLNPAYSLTMTSAVLLAVKKAAQYSEVLRIVFKFFSLVSRDSLPLEIAVKYVRLCNKDLDEEDVGVRIRKCSLILTEDQEVASIRLHRVVHEALKVYELPGEFEDEEIFAAARSLYLLKGRKNERTLVPHLIAFHAAAARSRLKNVTRTSSFEITEILCYFGQTLRFFGKPFVSKDFYVEAIHVYKKFNKAEDANVASFYDNLGVAYQLLGDFQQAKKYLKLSLEIFLKQLGSDHIDVANSYNNLGDLYRVLGDLQQAEKYHKLSLEIRLKQLGSDHIDVAYSYNNLGELYHDLRDLQQAKQYHELALEILLKQLGSDHVSVAISYNNLGKLYRALGDFQQAKEYYKLALEILLKPLGSDHIDVASCYNNLGNLYHTLGDFQQAKEYYELALEIRLKQFGSDHINVTGSYNNLGNLYGDLGDLKQAKKYYELALEIRLKELGSDHIDVADSYHNLGQLHHDLRDLQQAKQYYELALKIRLMQLGSDNIDVAISYNNLGELYRDLSDLQRAKQYHKLALEIRLKQFGSDHIDVGNSYNNLGNVYAVLGDLHQAKEYHELALEIRLKELGPDNINVTSSYNNLGNLHHDLGDVQQAKKYYELALEIRLKQLGSDHIDVARSYNNLGNLYRALGDLQQAKEYCELALEIRLKQLGPDHMDVANSYNNLSAVYRALGDLQQAKQYHELALEIFLKQLDLDHINEELLRSSWLNYIMT